MVITDDFGCNTPEWRELHVIAIPNPDGIHPHDSGVVGVYSVTVPHGKQADPGEQANTALDKFHESAPVSVPDRFTFWVFDPSSWLVLDEGDAENCTLAENAKDFYQIETKSPLHVYAVRMEMVAKAATKVIGDIVVVARNKVQARKRARDITWIGEARRRERWTYPIYTATRLA